MSIRSYKNERDAKATYVDANNSVFVQQFKNETFQSYSFCEYKNFTKTCYMIPIYLVQGF